MISAAAICCRPERSAVARECRPPLPCVAREIAPVLALLRPGWGRERRSLFPGADKFRNPTFAAERTMSASEAWKKAALAVGLGNDTPAGPRDVRKRPRAVGPAGLVGIAHGGVGAHAFRSVERCHILAERPFACGNRRPVVVEAFVVHADHQLHFRNVHETLLDKSPFQFTRLHHRLEAIAAAQLAPAFAEC